MHNKDKINTFIELRADNVTYYEIVVKLGVSKPTLISWGKKYKTEIKMKKLSSVLEEYAKCFLINENKITINAEWINRIKKTKDDKKRKRN
jgi:hypothetical protein